MITKEIVINAMMLYLLYKRGRILHGKAAEILSGYLCYIKFFQTAKSRKIKMPANPLKSRLPSIFMYITKQGFLHV